VPGNGESASRWLVTIVVTAVIGLLGVAATLIAAGKLDCPLICSSTPAPGATPSPPSTVDSGPVVAADRTSGRAGTSVQLTITGFGTNEPLDITLEDDRIGSATSDAKGSANVTIVVPASYAAQAPRALTIRVLGRTSQVVAAATFQLVP
jgi:hypothetical protein